VGSLQRVHTVSISDAGSLDTAQWNFVSDPIDAVPGEGGVDTPEPHLRGVGVVLSDAHCANEIQDSCTPAGWWGLRRLAAAAAEESSGLVMARPEL
jgi:hypothetical protein